MKNFRVFEKKEFVFDDTLCLVSGPSGTGKTSVFMAIMFALQGEGKKVVMFGKKSCMVELQLKGITIVRTKGPCRLVVTKSCGTKYEDKEGQAVINEVFAQNYLGYVPQRLHKAFICMTPNDKLRFIENIAFDNANIDGLNKKCRELISGRKEALMCHTRERDTMEKMLRDMSLKKMEVDDDETDDEYYLETQQASISKKISKSKTTLDTTKGASHMKRKLEEELEALPTIDADVGQLMNELIVQKSAWDRYDGELKKFKKVTHSGIDKNELSTMIFELRKIVEIDRELLPMSSLEAEITKLLNYKKDHSISYTCPLCKGNVGLWCDSLVDLSDCSETTPVPFDKIKAADDKLISLQCKFNKLKRKIDERAIVAANYAELDQGQILSQLKLLEQAKIMDEIYNRLFATCESLKCEQPEGDLDTLKDLYAQKKIKEDKIRSISKLPKLEKDIYTLEDEIFELDSQLVDITNRLKRAKSVKYWTKVDTLIRKEKIYEESLPRAVKLQSLIKTAEKMALEETIAQINLRAQVYLDKFSNNIIVSLVFDGRLNVEVFVNDHESDLNSLSGGELARVILAFTIALAEMNEVDILLLDESMASLDQETTTIVIETIKENFDGQIICIAHQTMKGIFNSVIEL